MSFIEVKDLHYIYNFGEEDAKTALNGVDMNIEKGEFVALLGHNGCGKSTLAKIFNGMYEPNQGSVIINGLNSSQEENQYQIRRTVGLVQQNPDNQLVAGIVEEDVAFGPENLGVPPLEIRKRVDDALKAVNMYEYREHAPFKLSGGQKQRVAIAGVLAMRTDCIVLDEPTAMLDPQGRAEVMETLKKLNTEQGITVILITHYMDEATQTDRVIVMDQGKVLTQGEPRKVFAQVELLKEHHLDVPQATEFAYLLKKNGIDIGHPMNTHECIDLLDEYIKDLPKTATKKAETTVANDVEKEYVIETKKLNCVYGKATPFEKTAVKSLSIKVEKGEILGLIGHTGSGKSTLVQMLNGLIRPTDGQVLLEGKDIWEEPKKIRAIRFKVGMVFQYPEYQLFEETVLKDICFGPMNMGLSEKEAIVKAREAAEFVGLKEELLQKSPFELSGGEKRRAAIAGVIAMNPQVLILDEPTAGLDPMGREMLLNQILKYHKETQNTIILVSHSMEDVGRACDRVLVMNKADKAMLDTTEKIFEKGPFLRSIGLRVPQITHIMSKLEMLGLPVDGGTIKLSSALEQVIPLLKGVNKL